MKSARKLEKLTKSIRLTNQAKILKVEIKSLSRIITILQENRLRKSFQADTLVAEAHKLQREAIPVQTIPTKQTKQTNQTNQTNYTPLTTYNQEKIDENTLVKIFGEEGAQKIARLSERLEDRTND